MRSAGGRVTGFTPAACLSCETTAATFSALAGISSMVSPLHSIALSLTAGSDGAVRLRGNPQQLRHFE